MHENNFPDGYRWEESESFHCLLELAVMLFRFSIQFLLSTLGLENVIVVGLLHTGN